MTDDLGDIENKFGKALQSLQETLTRIEIANILNQQKIRQLRGPCRIIIMQPPSEGRICTEILQVTELSTEVLRSKMEALRRLNPSPNRELTVSIHSNVEEKILAITISLQDKARKSKKIPTGPLPR